MFNIAPSRILLPREGRSICVCVVDIVYRVTGNEYSATTLHSISVLQVKGLNFMQFTDRWSVADSFLRTNLSWRCKKKKERKHLQLPFQRGHFFGLFHNFMLQIHADSLWGGFKMKTFMWRSLDSGANHRRVLANVWFIPPFFKSLASVCPQLPPGLVISAILCDSAGLLCCSLTKAGAGCLFRCRSSQINPGAFLHGLLLWCWGYVQRQGHTFQQPAAACLIYFSYVLFSKSVSGVLKRKKNPYQLSMMKGGQKELLC